MTQAKEILEMIESVDPKDSDKLDEIDARVWYCINDWEFNGYEEGHHLGRGNYTRSIDAQKALEVEGWHLQSMLNSQSGEPTKHGDIKYFSDVSRDNPYKMFTSPDLPTEPLARLYCWLCVKQFELEKDK